MLKLDKTKYTSKALYNLETYFYKIKFYFCNFNEVEFRYINKE